MKDGVTLAYDDDLFPDVRGEIAKPPPPTDWATVVELREVRNSTELIVQQCQLTKFAIGRAFGRDDLFRVLKSRQRVRRPFIIKLANIFGLTLEEFLGLNVGNINECKGTILENFAHHDVL